MATPVTSNGVLASPAVRGKRLAAQVEVHDRQQLELRLHYLLDGPTTAQRYTVDSYFFVPRNVGVNRSNYSRNQFYADVTSLMRLDAEPLPLDQLADPTCAASPLHGLAAALDQFRARLPPSRLPAAGGAREALRPPLRGRGQVGGEAAEAQAREGHRAMRTENVREQAEEGLGSDAQGALRLPGHPGIVLWPFEEMAHQSLRDGLRNADEYMSLVLEEQLSRLVDGLRDAAPAPG